VHRDASVLLDAAGRVPVAAIVGVAWLVQWLVRRIVGVHVKSVTIFGGDRPGSVA
jgi:hypothetical protein